MTRSEEGCRLLIRTAKPIKSGDEICPIPWMRFLQLRRKSGRIACQPPSIEKLKVGDVLPFRVPDNAEVSVNGFPVFKADIGSVGNQSAVKITETVMAGDDNE